MSSEPTADLFLPREGTSTRGALLLRNEKQIAVEREASPTRDLLLGRPIKSTVRNKRGGATWDVRWGPAD